MEQTILTPAQQQALALVSTEPRLNDFYLSGGTALQRPLEALRQDTETKFGLKIDSVFLGGELSKVKRIEALPKMIIPLELTELKSFFADQASQLAKEIF